MRRKFITLVNCIKEHISNDPYVSDVQVQQYRKMLKLNLKEQDEVLHKLTEEANIQSKRIQNGG
jgi:bifunctional ADP-heptose synthase (sugar kinase/adenylyltransferase)